MLNSFLTPDDLLSQNLILLEAISGSQAYGLSTPESDLDIRGVYIAPLEQLFGFGRYQAQVQDEAHNIVYYELGRFIELLSKNNPTVMELLATPQDCLRIQHPLMQALKPDLFLSKLCRDTFGQYALAQIRKARGLNKKISNPLEVKRKTVLDCCFVTVNGQSRALKKWLNNTGLDQRYCGLVNIDHMPHLFALYHDAAGQAAAQPLKGFAGIVRDEESSNDICLSSVPPNEPVIAYLSFNRDLYKKTCKDYKAYWDWVSTRNEARFQAAQSHGKNYDAKNMMHTFRLLTMAEEIAFHKEIRVRRPDREQLLRIRSGACDYDALLAEAEAKLAGIEALYERSGLPERPDPEAAQALLVNLRRSWYAD